MTDLADLLYGHEIESTSWGWSCKCGTESAHVDYVEHLAAVIASEFVVIPRGETRVEFGCRSHLGDEWWCEDRAQADSTARGRGGVVIERVVGPGIPQPPAGGFCGAEFINDDGAKVRCQRGFHVSGSPDPEHMLMGFPPEAVTLDD